MASTETDIARALKHHGFPETRISHRSLSGGCIHDVRLITLADDRRLVAKLAHADAEPVLRAEYEGLAALAEPGHLRVPYAHTPVVVDERVVLLMDAIDTVLADALDDTTWAAFGRSLAAHHAHLREPRYGFDHDNFIGATAQPNPWADDWVTFTAQHRLGCQCDLACSSNLLNEREADAVRRVIDRLPDFIPRHPHPALLHGDLWSGNALPARTDASTTVAVIDPAVHVGDGWADIAMMGLFGGFPEPCFTAYADATDDNEQIRERIAVYQLYHMLNHVNLLGRGYASSVMSLATGLTG